MYERFYLKYFSSHKNCYCVMMLQGFSLVIAQRKEKAFLVAYGGKGLGSFDEVFKTIPLHFFPHLFDILTISHAFPCLEIQVEVLHVSAKPHSKSPTLKIMKPRILESKNSLVIRQKVFLIIL